MEVNQTRWRTERPTLHMKQIFPMSWTRFCCFDTKDGGANPYATTLADEQSLVWRHHQVWSTLQKVSGSKTSGPEWLPGRALKSSAVQLAGMFTDILNLSLQQPQTFQQVYSEVPDQLPARCSPIIMKCFERLVLSHMRSIIPPGLGKPWFMWCHL